MSKALNEERLTLRRRDKPEIDWPIQGVELSFGSSICETGLRGSEVAGSH